MKKVLSILMVLALSLSLAAFAEGTFPVTVTDQAGREVTIEQESENIVSGYYIATSMLIALDQTSKLTGIENGAGKRTIYSLSAPELIDLPAMGTMKAFDLEACATLEPDLVILPLRQADTASTLEELGYTVLFVNPESPDLLAESIALLGAATGSDERAQSLQSYIDTSLADLTTAIGDEEAPSVYIAGNSALLKTAGPRMYQHEMILRAGGRNAAEELGDSYWAEISYEQLLAWDPDFILLASDAEYSVEDVLNDSNLQGMRAIENGNVFQLPGNIESWDSPVPASFLGSLYLATKLHPEKYSEASYQASVKEFYETFYGFTPEF